MTQADLSARLVALLSELNPDAVLWDGLNEAVTGIGLRNGRPVAIYDYERMVTVLTVRDSIAREDARDWVDFNIVCAYVGPGTPLHTFLDGADYAHDDGEE